MRIKIRPRQGGKTYELLVAMSQDPNIVMICVNHAFAGRAAEDLARMMGTSVRSVADRFLTPDKAQRRPMALSGKTVVVDNFDLLVKEMLGIWPDTVTMTEPATIEAVAQ